MTDSSEERILKLQKELEYVRAQVGHALSYVGAIRQGSNVSAPEMWTACEHLDNALSLNGAMKSDRP